MLKTTSALVAIMLSLGLLAAIAPTAEAGFVPRSSLPGSPPVSSGISSLIPHCPLGYSGQALANICVYRCNGTTQTETNCLSLRDGYCQPVVGSAVCLPADFTPGPYGCVPASAIPDVIYGTCFFIFIEFDCHFDSTCWCWTGPDQTEGYLNIYVCSSLFDQS
jgi:hypothetical protein